MPASRTSRRTFWTVQAVCCGAVVLAAIAGPSPLDARWTPRSAGSTWPTGVQVTRTTPLRVAPLYNDPTVVSDADLAAVLKQLRPRFDPKRIKPNYVEHALRIWSVDATFADPAVMSGAALKDFLVDNHKYLASWGPETKPLLVDEGPGVAIRYGSEEGASVHHDHWLACLTEAGASLDEPVFTASPRVHTLRDVLQQALFDFRLDEREVEWSAMGFGLWLPPQSSWRARDGRELSFDLLAERLLRGTNKYGVCEGTHRLYSLTLLLRMDQESRILSDATRDRVLAHLGSIRQLLIDAQFDDGHWPSNWQDGAAARANPVNDPLFKKVISTGHHLEWLAIAPVELHPPHDNIRKAAAWVIGVTKAQSQEQILGYYTFFSHVAGAMSLWRSQRPSDAWRLWEASHPEDAAPAAPAAPPTPGASAGDSASPASPVAGGTPPSTALPEPAPESGAH